METEVSGSRDTECFGLDKQVDYDLLPSEALLLECMPQLSDFTTNDNYTHLDVGNLSFEGESDLLQSTFQHECAFSMCSPSHKSATLADLLQTEQLKPADVQSTPEKLKLVEPAVLSSSDKRDTRGDITNTSTLAQLLTTKRTSISPQSITDKKNDDSKTNKRGGETGKSAMALLANMDKEDQEQIVLSDKTLAVEDDLSFANVVSVSEPAMVDIVNFPLFNLDDPDGLFEDGIAANDVGSLLRQFEDAAASLADELCPEEEEDILTNIKREEDTEAVVAEVNICDSSACQMSTMEDIERIEFDLRNEPDSLSEKSSPENGHAESEVMKLLKAGRSPLSKSASAQNILTASPSELSKKIKSSTKPTGAIMLSQPPFPRAKSDTNFQRKSSKEKMLSSNSKSSVEENNNSKEVAVELVKLVERDRGVKRISIEAYKARRLNRNSSCPSTPSSSLPSTPSNSRSTSPLPHSLPPIVLPPLRNFQVNRGYYDAIVDHDYCQNIQNSTVKEKSPQEESRLALKRTTSQEIKNDGAKSPDNVAMKTLLLDKNLNEQMKQQAEKDRAESRKNMKKRQRLDTDREVVDMELDSEIENVCNEETVSETEVIMSPGLEKNVPAVIPEGTKNLSVYCKRSLFAKRARPEQRKYRRHGHNANMPSSQGKENEAYMDKLPKYFTALSTPSVPGKLTCKAVTAQKLMSAGFPDRDRDPSPNRADPVFNKLPDYFSCFTNSTKYDTTADCGDSKVSENGDQEDIENHSWDDMHTHTDSTQASRSQTPKLVISSSRSLSRSLSRSSNRPKSGKYSRAASRSPAQRNRSQERSRSRHRSRRGSYSSCSSCSSSGSSSSSSSRSRSRSSDSDTSQQSASCFPQTLSSPHCQSRHSSQSRSSSPKRPRSRSKHRHSQSRHATRERSLSWDRWEIAQEKRREVEKTKIKQIEQRRIMYVGGIPNSFTRHDLKHKFTCFGDIEDVSVHFRDHGDNYGFVTFGYTCDAFAAIEKGRQIKGCEKFDLCFGGRRQFCASDYADLDGNQEEEEEMGAIIPRAARGSSTAAPSGNLDFDQLLKQATRKLKSNR